MANITAKDYVIHICKIKGLDLLKPSKSDKTILVWGFRESGILCNGHRCVVEATNWNDAKEQLNKYLHSLA